MMRLIFTIPCGTKTHNRWCGTWICLDIKISQFEALKTSGNLPDWSETGIPNQYIFLVCYAKNSNDGIRNRLKIFISVKSPYKNYFHILLTRVQMYS